MSKTYYLKISLALLGVILLAVLGLFDPAQTPWFPRCPVHSLTGLQCPGCGTQRALHCLMHADPAGAFRYNAMLLIMAPILALLLIAELRPRLFPRLTALTNSPYTALSLGIALILWTILRNILHL